MISHLKLNNFRGLEFVSFEDLGHVNLIVGGNNSGKTSLLEAITLLYGNHQQLEQLPQQFRQSAESRDVWSTFWKSIVYGEKFDQLSVTSDDVLVDSKQASGNGFDLRRIKKSADDFQPDGADQRREIIQVREPRNSRVNAGHSTLVRKLSILSTTQPDPTETSELFNQVAPLNPQNETLLQDLLRESIEPRLQQLRYAKPQGTHQHLVYVGLGSGPMIPFTQMGQAFSRALHIYCEIFAQRPDVLLIDEIENGLYYRGLEKFWSGLFAVLKGQNVQLFATTHSRECMDAAQKADAPMPESMLRFLRLDRMTDQPEKIVGSSLDSETMADAIEFGQEMR